jgi:hypothetical protein
VRTVFPVLIYPFPCSTVHHDRAVHCLSVTGLHGHSGAWACNLIALAWC